jgi:hypothetical protein
MANEAASGALSGAAAGAAAGTAILPGWGTAIGGVVGAAAGLIGGLSAGSKRKKKERKLAQMEAQNEAWYNNNVLSDYTQRADAQNLMKQLRGSLTRQNKAAENTAVITGATAEQQAAAKERSNKVISDTFSNIGALGQQWKDRITDKYLSQKNSVAGLQMSNLEKQAESAENLMNNGIALMGSSLNGLSGSLGKTKAGPSSTQSVSSPSALDTFSSNVWKNTYNNRYNGMTTV